MNRTKTKKLCKHTMSLLKQDRRNNNKNEQNKNSASTPCRVSIVSSPIDGKFKSKESQSYIIINTTAQSVSHRNQNKVGKICSTHVLQHDDTTHVLCDGINFRPVPCHEKRTLCFDQFFSPGSWTEK